MGYSAIPRPAHLQRPYPRGGNDQIVAGRGATAGIGSALARLVDVVIQDQRAMLTVCAPTPEVAGVTDVTVSLTHLVGGEEILVTLPLPLTGRETAALQANAQVICEVTDALKVYN